MNKKQPETAESFETAMSKLESIVENMEQGDLPLEDALSAFENGVSLVRQCQEKLKSAEQKVQILMKSGDESELKSFTTEDLSQQ